MRRTAEGNNDMLIAKIKSETQCYEVGKEDVSTIESTNHGSASMVVYKIANAARELIVHAGLLVPHEIKYAAEKREGYEQFTLFGIV